MKRSETRTMAIIIFSSMVGLFRLRSPCRLPASGPAGVVDSPKYNMLLNNILSYSEAVAPPFPTGSAYRSLRHPPTRGSRDTKPGPLINRGRRQPHECKPVRPKLVARDSADRHGRLSCAARPWSFPSTASVIRSSWPCCFSTPRSRSPFGPPWTAF